MPTVPRYDNFQVMPQVQPSVRMDAPVVRDIGGEQTQQMSRATAAASQAIGEIAQQIGQVRVNAGLNQVRQAAQTLAYDPQQGYLNLKGEAALNRPDGQVLPQEYGAKLDEQAQTIAQGLGDDYQRRLFQEQYQQIKTQFQGDVQRHMLGEDRAFRASTHEGTMGLAADDAERNWDNPDRIRGNVEQARAAVYSLGQMNGKSAAQIQLDQEQTTSHIHERVIESALQAGQPTYAQQYLNANKDQMTAAGILQVTGKLNHVLDGHVALQAVQAATEHFSSQTSPTDFDRLVNVVLGIESKGRDYAPDGTPTTSARGAKYGMQVMPTTAKAPGFGIAPAQDDSPAEYNRVGQQYLGALVKKYGNAAQALAAYNAGPQAVDDAVARAGKEGQPGNWVIYLPKETQTYVQTGMDKLNVGGDVPFPTESQFVTHAIGALGNNPRIEQVSLTREQATRQYEMLVKSRNEQGNNALRSAQQALVANGGNVSALDPSIKSDLMRYAPEKWDDVLKYARAVSRGDNETNPELYLRLSTYPEEMAKMPESAFMQLRTQLSEIDFKHFAKERGDILNGKVDASFGALNTQAVNAALANRMTAIGINPRPPASDLPGQQRAGSIQKFVRDYLFGVQQQQGAKLTPQQIEQQVDGLFAKNITFRTSFLGIPLGSSQTPLMEMKAADIPDDARAAIVAAYAKRGRTNPTDDEILRQYWVGKARNGR